MRADPCCFSFTFIPAVLNKMPSFVCCSSELLYQLTEMKGLWVVIAVAATYLLNSVMLVLSISITDCVCVCVFVCVCVCYLVSSVSFWAMECVIFTLYHILCFKMHTCNLFNVVTIKPLTQACQNCIKLINVSIDILLKFPLLDLVKSRIKQKGQNISVYW